MGEAHGFSLDVINEVRRAIDESNLKDYEVFKAADMSKDYFYKRMRGEKPFNTNDISKIADALGVDAFLILRRAAAAHKPTPAVDPVAQREQEKLEQTRRFLREGIGIAALHDPHKFDHEGDQDA